MTDEELDGQIEWFESLRQAHENGDDKLVKDSIDIALKMLTNEKATRTKGATTK